MSTAPGEMQRVFELLEEGPRRIEAAVAGVQARRLSSKPSTEAWSANEVLAHIRAAADVHGRTIAAIVVTENLAMRYVSPRTWMRKTNYVDLGFEESFEAYKAQRADLLRTLGELGLEDWSRSVTYIGATRRARQTVVDVAGGLARHEAVHCDQIAAILQ